MTTTTPVAVQRAIRGYYDALTRRLRDRRRAAGDRIVVALASGKVVEQVDCETLLARGGHYARLWALQARTYAD